MASGSERREISPAVRQGCCGVVPDGYAWDARIAEGDDGRGRHGAYVQVMVYSPDRRRGRWAVARVPHPDAGPPEGLVIATIRQLLADKCRDLWPVEDIYKGFLLPGRVDGGAAAIAAAPETGGQMSLF